MQAGALACRCLPLASTQRSLLRCHGAAAILVLLCISSVQCCHAVPLPHRDLQGLSVDDGDCRNEPYISHWGQEVWESSLGVGPRTCATCQGNLNGGGRNPIIWRDTVLTDAAYLACGARLHGGVKPNIHTLALVMPHSITGALLPGRVPSHAQHGCQHGPDHATRPPPQPTMHLCIESCHVMHPWPPCHDHGMCQRSPGASMISPRPQRIHSPPRCVTTRALPVGDHKFLSSRQNGDIIVAANQAKWGTFDTASYRASYRESLHIWAGPLHISSNAGLCIMPFTHFISRFQSANVCVSANSQTNPVLFIIFGASDFGACFRTYQFVLSWDQSVMHRRCRGTGKLHGI